MVKKYYCEYCKKNHTQYSKIGFLHWKVLKIIKFFIIKEYKDLLKELENFDNEKDNYTKEVIKMRLSKK